MGVSPVFLKALAILINESALETRLYTEHPSDDYQRGRALASQQLKDKIMNLIGEPTDDSEQ
jgi:hypothetical protein